jgi:t-SNARE complex subunit (syntaxin)
MSIYYYLYQVTNKLNNHIYIGVRKSKVLPLEDIEYMGSGKAIKFAIIKYGLANFEKTIISLHNSWNDALAEEARIVNSNFVLREDTYNLTLGGFGGSVKGHTKSDEFKRKLSIAKKGQTCPHKGKTLSEEHKRRISDSNKNKVLTDQHKQNLSIARNRRTELRPDSAETRHKKSIALLGRPRSEETKRKISETKRRKAAELKN